MTTRRHYTLGIGLAIAGPFIAVAHAGDLKNYHAIMPAPCAVDEDAAIAVMRAAVNRDSEALEGLVERGKVVILSKGTRFRGMNFDNGLIHGSVQSGRHTGESCYVIDGTMAE